MLGFIIKVSGVACVTGAVYYVTQNYCGGGATAFTAGGMGFSWTLIATAVGLCLSWRAAADM